MHDGALVGALGLGALYVYMYPLVVEGGIGKLIDAVLVDGKPLRGTNFLAQVSGKLFIRINFQHSLVVIIY